MIVPQQFFEIVDASGLRLTRPRKFIFLCGGVVDPTSSKPASAREAFLRTLNERRRFESHDLIRAEEIDTFYPDSPYRNLIEFEIDIARISDSVVLFSEGYGSLAELGAFSQIERIAERMMVIIQSDHHTKKSFIRDGPIRHLEQNYPKSVQVFDWHTHENGGHVELDEDSYSRQVDDIKAGIRDRLSDMPNMMKLNSDDFGHKIILAASISDVFGAATFDDFDKAFRALDITVSDSEIHRMLFCGHAVGWLILAQRGHQKFYLPNFETGACDFTYKSSAHQRDTTRWKRDIRAHWNEHDKLRSRVILDHPRETASS